MAIHRVGFSLLKVEILPSTISPLLKVNPKAEREVGVMEGEPEWEVRYLFMRAILLSTIVPSVTIVLKVGIVVMAQRLLRGVAQFLIVLLHAHQMVQMVSMELKEKTRNKMEPLEPMEVRAVRGIP